MIDWHTHILPGIDDGAAGMEQSMAMAAALSAAGYSEVYCTPHLIRGCYEATNDQVRQGVGQLQDFLAGAANHLKLHIGREYYLDEYLLGYLEEPLTIGDNSSVLIEIPPQTDAEMVRQVLYKVVRTGLKPIIAHPERCQLLELAPRRANGRGLFSAVKSFFNGGDRSAPEDDFSGATGNPLLDYLRDLGCSFQGNLGSFKGFYGSNVKRTAYAFGRFQLYDRYGSDLHSPEQAVKLLHSPLNNLAGATNVST